MKLNYIILCFVVFHDNMYTDVYVSHNIQYVLHYVYTYIYIYIILEYYIILYYVILNYIMLYYVMLYYATLCYSIRYCIILYISADSIRSIYNMHTNMLYKLSIYKECNALLKSRHGGAFFKTWVWKCLKDDGLIGRFFLFVL